GRPLADEDELADRRDFEQRTAGGEPQAAAKPAQAGKEPAPVIVYHMDKTRRDALKLAEILDGAGIPYKVSNIQEDPAAQIVVRHVALARMSYDDDRIIAAARELLALGADESRDWLDAIAWPDLADTCWGKRSHDNDRNVLVMRRGGKLDYKREAQESPGT